MPGPDRDSIAEEAARLVCREALTDYRAAKLKALDRLGMSARSTALPDNAQIDAAVIRYLQLRSEEHTSELQSLMRNSYAVFCLKTTNTNQQNKRCNIRRNI